MTLSSKNNWIYSKNKNNKNCIRIHEVMHNENEDKNEK